MNDTVKENKNKHIIIIMIIYLAGIFMGAIDTGIVTPARTLIQSTLGVDEQLGIWIITIYTLAYASSIPIMGKIADKYGRKYVYLISISLFGVGSLLSGLSQYAGSFTMLLVARAVQAIGGGGIMPIATAEFGTTFPKEKRGVALGLVGAVFGVANIFGATAGSFILDIFGHDNWSYIFFINLPITLFIILFGYIYLQNNKREDVKKIDYLGITFLTVTILSLLYGLRNIDFLHFWNSIGDYHVWPFLSAAVILIPIFVYFEKRAEDPVINLSYFKNSQIVITLALSFISGVILIGTIFVPQFAENSVKIESGSGGYFVMVLGLFAGIGAPLSGKLIDKFSVKPVLGFGFIVSMLAGLFLIFVAIPNPSSLTIIFSLVLMGFGMGFSLGTPLNYMMLENTEASESNSALATLSLIRSIGTTVAPSIMVAFLASAGSLIQPHIIEVLPSVITVPEVRYATEITEEVDALKEYPQYSEYVDNFDVSQFTKPYEIPLDTSMNSDENSGKIDPDILNLIQKSDVTNIGENVRLMYQSMFQMFLPTVVENIQNGVQSGIDQLNSTITEMNSTLDNLQSMLGLYGAVKQELAALPTSSFDGTSLLELLSAATVSMLPEQMQTTLSTMTTLNELNAEIGKTSGMLQGLQQAMIQLSSLVQNLSGFKYDVALKFNQGMDNYLTTIDNQKLSIENEFQTTLNVGFRNIYITTLSTSLLGFIILRFYKKQ